MADSDRYLGMTRQGGGFQGYAAGNKRYGMSGRSAPNLGPVRDRSGYQKRDALAAARGNLVRKRMQRQMMRKTSMY